MKELHTSLIILKYVFSETGAGGSSTSTAGGITSHVYPVMDEGVGGSIHSKRYSDNFRMLREL
jgi:hypothetical protein